MADEFYILSDGKLHGYAYGTSQEPSDWTEEQRAELEAMAQANSDAVAALAPNPVVGASIDIHWANGRTERLEFNGVDGYEITPGFRELAPVDGWRRSEPTGKLSVTITGQVTNPFEHAGVLSA